MAAASRSWQKPVRRHAAVMMYVASKAERQYEMSCKVVPEVDGWQAASWHLTILAYDLQGMIYYPGSQLLHAAHGNL